MTLIRGVLVACTFILALFVRSGTAQSVPQLQALQMPTELALSPDGSELHFKLGSDHWRIATYPGSKAVHSPSGPPSAKAEEIFKVDGSPRASMVTRSPDGTKMAFLESARPETALSLFCRCEGERGDYRKLSTCRSLGIAGLPTVILLGAGESGCRRYLWSLKPGRPLSADEQRSRPS